VIRVPIGGYLTGGSIYHSQSGESIFTHIPGFARGVSFECAGCQRAVADGDSLRRSGAVSGAQAAVSRAVWARAVSGAGLHDSIRQGCKIVRAGTDVTIVTYGALVPRALQAAQKAEREHGMSEK
jgi:2-oxoisovalerate dehydrogenase E1 component